MFLLVLAIIFALVALGGLAGIAVAPETDEKAISGVVGVICLILAVLMFVLSGIREVPTKSLGVVTSFGRVENTVGSGLHWMAPWKTVNILDETIQTTTYEGTNNCLDVRIGGQQTGCLDITIQWRVDDKGASNLFYNYAHRGDLMTEITNAVVVRELKSVVNNIMGDYNPIQDVAANAKSGNSQFSTFGPVVLRTMRNDLANRIDVTSLYMPFMHYDQTTQDRLNSIQQQYAETAIANQQYFTNQAQAKANGQIRNSVTNDPGVLQYQCLQLVQNAEKLNYQLPAGFNCTGASSVGVVAGH